MGNEMQNRRLRTTASAQGARTKPHWHPETGWLSEFIASVFEYCLLLLEAEFSEDVWSAETDGTSGSGFSDADATIRRDCRVLKMLDDEDEEDEEEEDRRLDKGA